MPIEPLTALMLTPPAMRTSSLDPPPWIVTLPPDTVLLMYAMPSRPAPSSAVTVRVPVPMSTLYTWTWPLVDAVRFSLAVSLTVPGR